ncbi:hypothetical protein Tco_0331237 [Tanacetum coccineum]
MNEFAPHRLPQPKGNMNGWLIEDEEDVERNEVDSDLESTASSKHVWKKTTKADHDRASHNCPYCSNGNNDNNNNENPDIATIIAHQLQTILPQIVTQVTNNVNNANNGNGGNGGGGNGNGGNNECTFKAFQSCNPKEYDGKGGMERIFKKKAKNDQTKHGMEKTKSIRSQSKLSKYTSNLGTQHWQAIQSVLKYLKKTMDYRLKYTGYPSVLEGYTDASWISNTEYNSSTSGWVFLLGGDAISWASKKQTCITGSIMES